MTDKNAILQIFCGLMKNPDYLSEKDKYNLTINDFSTIFEKYIFSAIYNLHKDGAKAITPVDIDNYFDMHPSAKVVFEKEKGIEYLQDALDFGQQENFIFYYKRLKKINCLNELKAIGYDTSKLYCEDLSNPKQKEINEKFDEYEVKDIFEILEKQILKLKSDFLVGDASETINASEGMEELVQTYQRCPEVGSRLQGNIFNTICRGARKTKFYIRSADSGTGKTRLSIGDACYLSYPIRFNVDTWEWEWNGSNEKTLFIATEQDAEEIQTLILSYLTGLNEEKILYNQYTEAEKIIRDQALEVIEEYKDNLFIVRIPNPSIEQIKAVIRQNWLTHNIQNVFYDYIFSSPSLLNEFRDLRIREDVALGMLSTALKDLAVEMGLFIMSSTQTNAKSDESRSLRDANVIRGSRAIVDKCDIGCVISRVTEEEEELLKDIIEKSGIIPNQVTDVYKVRRGRYSKVRIWSYIDLGCCRREDLFVTKENLAPIDGFRVMNFVFEGEDINTSDILKRLNSGKVKEKVIEKKVEEEKIDIEQIPIIIKKKGLFGDLC